MKRSDHKHSYRKIILHHGGNCFSWGRKCEICGRIDSTYKASYWRDPRLEASGEKRYGNWEEICVARIKEKFPAHEVYSLGGKGSKAEWSKR